MNEQLPAILKPGTLATPTDTYIVPALIALVGDRDARSARIRSMSRRLRLNTW